jgi:hypothetical protein
MKQMGLISDDDKEPAKPKGGRSLMEKEMEEQRRIEEELARARSASKPVSATSSSSSSSASGFASKYGSTAKPSVQSKVAPSSNRFSTNSSPSSSTPSYGSSASSAGNRFSTGGAKTSPPKKAVTPSWAAPKKASAPSLTTSAGGTSSSSSSPYGQRKESDGRSTLFQSAPTTSKPRSATERPPTIVSSNSEDRFKTNNRQSTGSPSGR